MIKKNFLAVLATLLLGTAIIQHSAAPAVAEPPLRGVFADNFIVLEAPAPAPKADFRALSGDPAKLSDYRGRLVLLNFWATWCKPCRDEMPSMEKLYNKFKSDQFGILAVSIDGEGRKVVAPFMKRLNLTFPALLDRKGKIKNIYGVTGIPESFIIGKNGIILKKVIGPIDWAKPDVSRFFKDLLQTPRS